LALPVLLQGAVEKKRETVVPAFSCVREKIRNIMQRDQQRRKRQNRKTRISGASKKGPLGEGEAKTWGVLRNLGLV